MKSVLMAAWCRVSVGRMALCCGVFAVWLLVSAMGIAAWAKPGDEQAYHIQAGDTLEVRLWNEEGNIKEFTVGVEGSVIYPLVGAVAVRGLTLEEAAARLTDALRKHIRNPIVTVAVKASQTPGVPAKRVYLLGQVNRPGPYAWSDGMRVIEALSLAGGLAANADGARAILSRGEQGATPLDLGKLLAGDVRLNVPLNADDFLVVPARQEKDDAVTVTVIGYVARPGSHRLEPGATVSDAIATAGGATLAAALRKATLTRAGLSAPVDLEAILRRGELAGNHALQDGDVLFVPESRNEVVLVGEFQKPGTYTFKDGDTLMSAMALGGGYRPEGDARRAVLKRGGKEIRVDLEAMLRRGGMQHDQPLQGGDVVFIPQGTSIYVMGAVGRPGQVTVREETRLVDVLMQAGGYTQQANPERAGVVREVKGEAQVMPLNIKVGLTRGGEALNFVFASGDVLYVPERGQAFDWRGVISTLYSLRLLGFDPLGALR